MPRLAVNPVIFHSRIIAPETLKIFSTPSFRCIGTDYHTFLIIFKVINQILNFDIIISVFDLCYLRKQRMKNFLSVMIEQCLRSFIYSNAHYNHLLYFVMLMRSTEPLQEIVLLPFSNIGKSPTICLFLSASPK